MTRSNATDAAAAVIGCLWLIVALASVAMVVGFAVLVWKAVL